jgi:hypothetical protein
VFVARERRGILAFSFFLQRRQKEEEEEEEEEEEVGEGYTYLAAFVFFYFSPSAESGPNLEVFLFRFLLNCLTTDPDSECQL